MTKPHCLTVLITLLITSRVLAQSTGLLQQKIEHIIAQKKATVGVSISGIEDHFTLNIHDDQHFPMQSVFKFHIALAVLKEVDKGNLSLKQKIFIKKSDLSPNTWSPLREKYPDGNVQVSLAEIITYTVAQSDNNGCDILLRLIGGAAKVNDYIHRIGVEDVAIQANEAEMHRDWNVQFTNWTTPSAATTLLKMFYERKDLSEKRAAFLWKVMSETTTGKSRIKGQLPEGTPVAHKTGTSDTNEQGVTAAVNDIGIVTLPGGKHFAIAVFVSNSREDNETNEKIISDIAKAAWDYFLGETK